MTLNVFRSSFHLSKILSSNKSLIFNSITKSLFPVGPSNTRTITRSLFFLCKNRDSDVLNFSAKVPWSNKCGCGCSMHTKGDQELAAFLTEEIENEKKNHVEPKMFEDFQCETKGAEVILTKKLENESITIKSNVNNSVDAEESVMDPNETKEPQEGGGEMKAKPEFTIEIKKGKKVLSFLCSYSQVLPEEEGESYNDAFEINEVSLYAEDLNDSTYCVSGEIMDGYLYDLLMNYLEERGISNEFADKMIAFFTSYEHKLYINLLQGMKAFVEK